MRKVFTRKMNSKINFKKNEPRYVCFSFVVH